jgi:hypothetical protein
MFKNYKRARGYEQTIQVFRYDVGLYCIVIPHKFMTVFDVLHFVF